MAKETNNHFGRYRVLGALGSGACGKLYLTSDPAGARAVLLIFHSQLSTDVRLRAAMLDGAQVAAMLSHENVAATYESGETEGRTFVTTEYLPGESLSAVMAVLSRTAEPMPPAIAATILRGLAAGLAYLHVATDGRNAPLRLLHRDLRPANAFVTFDGIVKIAGAGIGAALVTSPDLRAAARGGFAYASPEDVQSGALDVRSDLFSLGVMLWEWLTGKRLFVADSVAKTIEAVRSRYVEPPSILQSAVPPGLDEIALRLLSRDPRRRYQTADELVSALDSVLLATGGQVSSGALGEWMEGLFGRERAELKKQIAKGVAVEAALARLRLLGAVTSGDERSRERPSAPHAQVPASTRRDSQQVSATRPPTGAPAAVSPPVAPPTLPEPTGSSSARLAPLRLSPGTPAQSHVAEQTMRPRTPSSPSSPAIPAPLPGAVPPRSTPGGTPRISSPAMPVVSAPPTLSGPGTLTVNAPRARRLNPLVIAGVILGLGGIVAAAILLSGNNPEPTEAANVPVGILDVQSNPPGARVLLDGDPSGLVTPAHVTGLRAGRRIEVQIDKPGYKTARQTAEIGAGTTRTVVFQLEEAMGIVKVQGLPPRGIAFVDDQQVDAGGPLSLPIGPHRLRVELAGKLYSSTKVDVIKGEQTVHIRPLEEGGK